MRPIKHLLTIDMTDLTPSARAAFRKGVDAAWDYVAPQPKVGGWTPSAAAALLTRLIKQHFVQAEVIRTLADTPDHRVERATVYGIGGYPSNRTLKGFTRPVTRIMDELKAEGLLDDDAVDPMTPDYTSGGSGYQRARAFTMPADVAEIFKGVT